MAPVVAVFGYGPGISRSVALKFGSEGYKVALVSRSADKLAAYAAELKEKGIEAAAFPTDLTALDILPGLFQDIQSQLGPVTVLVWNQYSHILSDPLEQTVADLEFQFRGLASFVRTVQLAVPQLEAQAAAGAKPAIAVTGGGFSQSEIDPVTQFAASWNAHIPASISAAKHNLVATLRHTLAPKGIKVTEVQVTQQVKGTAFDGGAATLDPADVGEAFWKQVTTDTPWFIRI